MFSGTCLKDSWRRSFFVQPRRNQLTNKTRIFTEVKFAEELSDLEYPKSADWFGSSTSGSTTGTSGSSIFLASISVWVLVVDGVGDALGATVSGTTVGDFLDFGWVRRRLTDSLTFMWLSHPVWLPVWPSGFP